MLRPCCLGYRAASVTPVIRRPQSDALMARNEAHALHHGFRTLTLATGAGSPDGSRSAGRRPATREAHEAIFAEAVEILANEFQHPIRVEDVARRLATSPRQLQRVFADVGGLGFRSYLRWVRMSHAADALHNTDTPVKDIARRVGYRDPSEFSKAFKRTYGVTPSQARALRRGHGSET
jgi:AraC family transcriptional regulator of adaptative response / methylphosphotriester-DNA alkyltransferase methyltransferase